MIRNDFLDSSVAARSQGRFIKPALQRDAPEIGPQSCFVIQPFDRGIFDKRYVDIFAPAIREAGLEPYRVDHDPMVSIPIQEIENGIRGSKLCFAEI